MTPYQGFFQKRQRSIHHRQLPVMPGMRRWLTGSLFLGVIGLGVAYIVVVNTVSTKGLRITELQYRVAALRESNDKIALNIAELQSLNNLEQRIGVTSMQKVANVEYISSATAVAAR